MTTETNRQKAIRKFNEEIERDREALEGMSTAERRAMRIVVVAAALAAVVLFWIFVK